MHCVECDTTLTGRQTRFCSRKCSARNEGRARVADGRIKESRQRIKATNQAYARLRYKPGPGRPEAMCAACGQPTGKAVRNDRARVCSNKCRRAMQKPRPPKPQPIKFTKPPLPTITVTCRRCSTVFLTDIHTKLYCSTRCKKNKDCQEATTRQATCARCTKDFTTDRSWQLHCSPRCGRAAARERRNIVERATSSASIGRVDRGHVFQRDEWVCQLCDYPTNPDVTVPDYEAPTIDHIVPLARGGSHTMDNVQTAHFLCNMLKGDSLAS